MKPIAIIALVLGIAGGGVAVYHLVETYPNVKAFSKEDKTGYGGSSRRRARLERLRWRLEQSYRDAAFNQVYAMWGLGGLGLILGILGFAKLKDGGKFRTFSIVGAALSAIVLIVSLTTIMASRLG